MNLFSLEEFTARRRTTQVSVEEALRPDVKRAVDLGENTHGWNELLSTASDLYSDLVFEESGLRGYKMPGDFRQDLLKALQQTKDRDKNSVERITAFVATALISRSTIAAAEADDEDLFLEWVDMGDRNVRHAHEVTSGQVRPIGEPFDVDGTKMPYPGYPGVAVELWINCRCTLRPVLATEALTAAAPERDSIPAMPGEDSRAEQPECTCCGGPGEHTCGHECYACDASGRRSAQAETQETICPGHHGVPDPCNDGHTGDECRHDPDPVSPDAVPDGTPSRTAGGAMTDTATEAPVDPPAEKVAEDTRVPWHGILAPENVRSGDGRRFKEGSLTTRPLPLPLTWQKMSTSGHDNSVVVATIEKAEMVDGLMRASGYFLSTTEADEVIGLIGEFGKFGVSVDADDIEMELADEESDTVDFAKARVSGAAIVPIPAFAEAWVALGHWDDEDVTKPVSPTEINNPEIAAGLQAMREKVQTFKDLAPGKTEDGPGWLTHPVDTDRLRDYWVRGAGAAKIGWGTPGDFNRCRVNVAEYVAPQYINGYCANRHYDALGFWPGRPVAGDTAPFAADTLDLEDTAPAPAVSLVASVVHTAPAEWFQNPNLTEPTHVTVTDEGRVYGHVAEWGVCHLGFKGLCTTAPQSMHDYAYFTTGQVALDNGTRVNTGPISIGGGHADGNLSMRSTVAHYDRTSTAVCDVTVGEDEFGIWCAGWLRPGVSKDMATALMASDVSGDWREIAPGVLEMCAVLAVNVGGFSVLRPRLAASGERQLSLVAAGVIHQDEETKSEPKAAERIALTLADEVASILERRQQAREAMAALAARVNGGQD